MQQLPHVLKAEGIVLMIVFVLNSTLVYILFLS